MIVKKAYYPPAIFVFILLLISLTLAWVLFYINSHKNLDANRQNYLNHQVLFMDALDGPDRLVTNEFTYWNNAKKCPYSSNKWDMTSGTLLIKDGAGYSGIPSRESKSICESMVRNNSAIFRLNTKDHTFSNSSTSMDYKMVAHSKVGANSNNYDGIHIWTRYQTDNALYVVSIGRWDGVIVIKKKVPVESAHCVNPANDGCYYELTPEIIRKDLAIPNVWHHAEVRIIDNNLRYPVITLFIDNKKVVNGSDNNVVGPAYKTGAVGVRGDNTEFYFKNFFVNAL